MKNEKSGPVYIMPENTERNYGREAQKNNILAAKLVAESVRTTLGPKGMDKMIVDSTGDVIVTNDGVTILEEMNIEHPAAKMLVEIARTQEDEIGDGTTTAVVFAGELLKKAENLLEQNIHPTVITKGYRLTAKKATELLKSIAEPITIKDQILLENIAHTAMTGKGAEAAKKQLSKIVVESIRKVIDHKQGKNYADFDNIKIEKKTGGTINDSELIDGIILDKEILQDNMPKKIINAKIALLNSPLEIRNTEIDSKISITDPEKIQSFLDMEESMLKKIVNKVVDSGANVLLCQKGIEDTAQHFLAKKGILALRRIKKSDLDKLARATGANIVSNLNDLNLKDLGMAGVVEEKKIGEAKMTFIQNAKKAKAVTILLRGGTEHIIEEAERAVKDALGDVNTSLKDKRIVTGAGSIEMFISRYLKKYANKFSGREQLAMRAFANSLEIIPKTLAENSGLDPIDILTNLRAKHDSGKKWAGVDVFTGKIMNSKKLGVIEPLRIKIQAINSATEVATMVLRVDDVIASGKDNVNNMQNEHFHS